MQTQILLADQSDFSLLLDLLVRKHRESMITRRDDSVSVRV